MRLMMMPRIKGQSLFAVHVCQSTAFDGHPRSLSIARSYNTRVYSYSSYFGSGRQNLPPGDTTNVMKKLVHLTQIVRRHITPIPISAIMQYAVKWVSGLGRVSVTNDVVPSHPLPGAVQSFLIQIDRGVICVQLTPAPPDEVKVPDDDALNNPFHIYFAVDGGVYMWHKGEPDNSTVLWRHLTDVGWMSFVRTIDASDQPVQADQAVQAVHALQAQEAHDLGRMIMNSGSLWSIPTPLGCPEVSFKLDVLGETFAVIADILSRSLADMDNPLVGNDDLPSLIESICPGKDAAASDVERRDAIVASKERKFRSVVSYIGQLDLRIIGVADVSDNAPDMFESMMNEFKPACKRIYGSRSDVTVIVDSYGVKSDEIYDDEYEPVVCDGRCIVVMGTSRHTVDGVMKEVIEYLYHTILPLKMDNMLVRMSSDKKIYIDIGSDPNFRVTACRDHTIWHTDPWQQSDNSFVNLLYIITGHFGDIHRLRNAVIGTVTRLPDVIPILSNVITDVLPQLDDLFMFPALSIT